MSIIRIRDNNTWKQYITYVRDGGVWKPITTPTLYTTELVIYILSANNFSANNQNVNIQQLFESTYPGSWSYNVPKRVIIDPGAIVGATNTGSYALNISVSVGGSLTIDNYGSILGAGGLPNSGTGGNAIIASSPVTFNNQGTIYAGGGAGGAGGAGGMGYYDCSYVQILGASGCVGCQGCDFSCQYYFQNYDAFCNAGCYSYPISEGVEGNNCNECGIWVYQNCYTSGGAGGAGGRGQGYDGNLTGGSPGGAGGINAGVGGYGGTGGNWGQSGGSGFSGSNGNYTGGTGGGPGGLAGYYIVNNGNVTWTNLGTVAGGVI